jgi:membrane protein YdbS with pleckstrin-like domain
MKNYRPAFARSICSAVNTAFWTAFWAASWVGLVELIFFLNTLDHPRSTLSHTEVRPWLVAGVVGIGAIGLLCLFRGVLLSLTERYVIGPADLTTRTGALWQTSATVSLLDSKSIRTSSGPLMRLFGLEDIHVGILTLRGIPEGDKLGAFLLERRESLRTAALSGDFEVARTSQEIVMARLTRAIERLDGGCSTRSRV